MKNTYRKHFFNAGLVLLGAGLLLAAVSCQKGERLPYEGTGSEIVLGLQGGMKFNLTTKTSEVVNVPPTLYWGATTGSSTESVKWASASASTSGGKIYTGKYQTASATTYNYYVSNINMSVGASTTVSASNTTDVVCGRLSSSSTSPSITLGHIFTRIGTLTVSAAGYTVSNVSWSIKSKSAISGTAGVYNLTSGSWTSATTTLSSYTSIGSGSGSGSGSYQISGNDLYLIPGTYTIKVEFDLTKGGKTVPYTGTKAQVGEITLVQGKKCNITASATAMTIDWDNDWDDGDETELD